MLNFVSPVAVASGAVVVALVWTFLTGQWWQWLIIGATMLVWVGLRKHVDTQNKPKGKS